MTKTSTFKPDNNLVIFAGAGSSMAPPSSLPGWYDLNDAILDTLWDRLEEYNITNEFREKILPTIKKRRNENQFPPDYQAQLMAERVGLNYFKLLGVVDSATYNPVQYYTALLAKEGKVKAVVTTNFDQNFERAFDALGVSYKSFFDENGFNSLTENIEHTIPIIKIHGTSTSPISMIDTRKQRLKGRSATLEKALQRLLYKYHFIFAGFSGQDFDDNENYLGFRNAAPKAKGFTFINFPGSPVRQSMNDLISFYGELKATAIEDDPALYLEEMVKKWVPDYQPFQIETTESVTIKKKLTDNINDLHPMDALNMLTALTESYGDEVSARFLYDKTWKNRNPEDYKGEGMSRFLLHYGRSYVFNFQERLERAAFAGASIVSTSSGSLPEGAENYFTNPAKQNLKHVQNTSPETIGLIALTQTYLGNPILFSKFPEELNASFQTTPTITERADIIYYYSHFAMIYGSFEEGLRYLNWAIENMEKDFDEPRLSRLLSRRALIKFRISHDEAIRSGEEDAIRAKDLAEKYHESMLLALANLALATGARIKKDFHQANELIQHAINGFTTLGRIPQFIECMVEHLKIIFMGFGDETVNSKQLLEMVEQIIPQGNKFITERIHVFEPEYCYLIGMILINYTDAAKEQYLPWFADAITFAQQYQQDKNYSYYRETCTRLNILDEVEQMIQQAKPEDA